MIVDDEQSLAKVLATYLERDGHQAECVFDGPARWPPPDIDHQMWSCSTSGCPAWMGSRCRPLRTFTDCYVVMLTARTEVVGGGEQVLAVQSGLRLESAT